MIRVLIVDDSPFMRRALTKILEESQEIEVVATARDGLEAIDKAKKFTPDVVALDINMPRMNGLAALQHIMIETPRPCVIISSLTQEGAEETLEALELGAVDYMPKPSGAVSIDIAKQGDLIRTKIKAASRARLPVRIKKEMKVRKELTLEEEKKRFTPSRTVVAGTPGDKIIAIGISTGGPRTLFDVIPKLPADLNATVVVGQHMPGGFTTTFARRLGDYSKIAFKEADQGESLEKGVGYLAPGQFHMSIDKRRGAQKGVICLSKEPTDALYRPSVDILFESVAAAYGSNAIGVIMTGMGSDGVKGLEKIKNAGGVTIAEHESTCVIYGMPKGAVEKGIADYVLPSHKIAEKIVSIIG